MLGRTPLAVVKRVQLVHVSFPEGLLSSLVLWPPDAYDLRLLRDVRLEHRLDLAIELVGRHLVLGLLNDAALYKLFSKQLGPVPNVASVSVGPRLLLVCLLDRVKTQLILQVDLFLLTILAQLPRDGQPLHLDRSLDRLLALARLIPSHHAGSLRFAWAPPPREWMSAELLVLDELLLKLHLLGLVAALEVALDRFGIELAVICLDDAL